MPLTLTLVARLLPPLFAVAIGVYATWCQAIAFVGGTIPLIGWHLEGGVLTGVLWAVGVADRPADPQHPYGHGKAQNLSALAEAAILVLLAGRQQRQS